jgi:hypothetical protein
MNRTFRNRARRGSLIPLLAVSIISLFAFVALAVDLGMLAVSRTHCQNAADAAALSGCRTLNNKPGVVSNNLAQAVTVSKATTKANHHLSPNFTDAQIQKIEAGQYLYDTAAQVFRGQNWTDVTSGGTPTPPNGSSWTAIRVTLSVTQPTYFMKVFGVTSMPTGATATAVHRPRDVAFVLDMTGSMAYASQFNYGGRSLNPDTLVPSFGHYASVQANLTATVNEANGSGEAFSRNNFTITTPSGPPIVRSFYFDPVNAANPTALAYPVTIAGSVPDLKNAFHRWSPPESGGSSITYTPPTYDFTGYNAFHNGTEASPKGPTPAPDTFGTMTDSAGITYVGDRWRRADGSINKTNSSWDPTSSTTRAAVNAIELLGYNASGGTVYSGTTGGTSITTEDRFRDLIWETYGYDLNIAKYRTQRAGGLPLDPATYLAINGATLQNILLPAEDRFTGYSMGPGYWGKTFYIWPPDPRDPAGNPGDANYQAGDWRRRYFRRSTSTAFDPQSDNNGGSSGYAGINGVLLNTSTGGMTITGSTGNYVIDYSAVLKWIKSGPQTLPPNLRAGRVLYYASIPNDVNTGSGTTQERLDKVFWREYIDYVLSRGYTSSAYLYGRGDSWSAAPENVMTSDLAQWRGPISTWSNSRPYMRYSDSPNRPRLHFWFGPLSMMDFIGGTQGQPWNWRPGNCYEAQCWQLKAGMNAAVNDVRNNHPNDYVGLVMFAANAHNGIRRPLGQNYNSLKNALFYPKSLLNTIDAGDQQSELRPYDLSFNSVDADEIPNASGSTDPNTGLAYAFNLLSPSAQLDSAVYGTVKGRRGASKVVIFETDGVPNTYRGLSTGTRTMNPTLRGYNTYYENSTWSSGNLGNGNATSMNEAIKVVQQMVKPMAATNATGVDSGLSLPNAPARVYPIAFGDLFDAELAPNAMFRTTALQFMANIAGAGNTGPAGATTLPDTQIITGSYDQRITRLKDCLERIFQSGVSVILVE